jgi:hypothetical protein
MEAAMKAIGKYDGTLQMFVEEPRDADVARLGFIRWLAEHGKLEHAPAGPAVGEFTSSGPVKPVDEFELLLAS